MKMEITVTEALEMINEIRKQPDDLFEMIRTDVRKSVGHYLSELMDTELTYFLGRKRYERIGGNRNHRNGSYARKYTLKGIGKVAVRVPRDRNGDFKTQVIPRSRQYEDSLREDLCVIFLSGVSTRTLALISEKLIGRRISATEVSKASKQLTEAVEAWRERDLSAEPIKYMYVDGTLFSMRIDGSIEKVPVLVVIGVTETGHRTVLGLQSGDKESATSWREMFKDLKRRGLDASRIQLGIMDGLPGLERVFAEEFTQAKVQRCQIHVARNVLAKVPKKLKKDVADEVRSIFYASSKRKAMQFFESFKAEREKDLPSAVKCLENSLNACLTYLQFPEEEWICLRTTNVIERVNKEFKRRTKPMEILAGERSCYTLLAFVCLKMELHWRSKPIGKVAANLPFMKNMAENNFTHNS
ncbi:MAG: IS256 family transposase [Deltaproteobacteria bacterium]|nr:MAG: IS256 family transposase [Deltaproteobacteria bacterium]